jgi:acetyl-CoA acetyltransferase
MISGNLIHHRQVALVGVGETAYYKHGESPRGEFELCLEAILRACEDAGLPSRSIDGFASYAFDNTNVPRLAGALGLEELRYSNMVWWGGGGGVAAAVGNAAAAIAAGYAETVVVLRSLVQGNVRYGAGRASGPAVTGSMAYLVPHGMSTPAQSIALRTRRFMFEHDVSQEALEAIALASYEHAQRNPRAVMHGRPLTADDYRASRWIVEPFHLFDCCQETCGAAAIILTTSERSADLRQLPVHFLAAAEGSAPGFELFNHSCDPYATANFGTVAKRLFTMAAIAPDDVDVVQVYENFTGGAMMSIIEHGFCDPEEANEFFKLENLIWKSGRLPLNTSGGNLAESYIHGLELVVEAVRQLRGSSTCQVPDASICLVAGGPCTAPVSSLLLCR